MDNLKIGREQAVALDEMLRKCDNPKRHYTYSNLTDSELDDISVTAGILSRIGYVKVLGRSYGQISIMILSTGLAFIRNESFLDRFEEEKKKQKDADLQRKMNEESLKLTEHQIKAAKREPYIIIWSIITTITSIILAIMQLTK